MLSRMRGQVSPKMHELLGDKFANCIPNNSDFDIFDIIEIQNRIRIDGRIDLWTVFVPRNILCITAISVFRLGWSECDVTYVTLAMAAILCWQSKADCAELKLEPDVWNTSDQVVLRGSGGVYCAFLCSWLRLKTCHGACDEYASGEICSLQHMWVTGSVMWAVASGASLKFGVQGASTTNWFSRVNDARDNGIRLYAFDRKLV